MDKLMFKLFFRDSEEIILNPCKISVCSGLRSAIKNLPSWPCCHSILFAERFTSAMHLSSHQPFFVLHQVLKTLPTAEWHVLVLVFLFCCLSIFIFLNFHSLLWDEDFPWRWGILLLTNSKSYPSKIYA